MWIILLWLTLCGHTPWRGIWHCIKPCCITIKTLYQNGFFETICIYVNMLNSCDYCARHHFSGLKRVLKDNERSHTIWEALSNGDINSVPISERKKEVLIYAKALTKHPENISKEMIETLRISGFSDGEILEINQVTAYFAYANRTVTGLGCSTGGDVLGLSPNNSDDSNYWGMIEINFKTKSRDKDLHSVKKLVFYAPLFCNLGVNFLRFNNRFNQTILISHVHGTNFPRSQDKS